MSFGSAYLGVAGGSGQHHGVDADLGHGPLPLVVQVGAENQIIVGSHMKPAVGLDFRVQLPRPPAGIAERQKAVARAYASGDVSKNIHGGGQRHLVVYPERCLPAVVGRVKNEPPTRFDGAAGVDDDLRIVADGFDAELFQKIGKGYGVQRPINDKAHGAFDAVGAYADYRFGETRVHHPRHGDEELSGECFF